MRRTIFLLLFFCTMMRLPIEQTHAVDIDEKQVKTIDLQNSPKEKIYLKSKDGEVIGFPLFTKEISGLVGKEKIENGDAGTFEKPISVRSTAKTLHKVITLLTEIKHLGRNNRACVVDPENFSKKTIFVSSCVNREVFPLLRLNNEELEQLYLAVLELDIDPLVNSIAAKIVSQLRNLAINGVKVGDALTRSGFNNTPEHGYISLHYKCCQNKKEYYSVGDYIGERGQSGLIERRTYGVVALQLDGSFTSFKGLELIDNDQITHMNIWRFGHSNRLQSQEMDAHFPSKPFVNFKNLKSIAISDLLWDTLPETFFDGVDKLEKLELIHCDIATLPRTILRKLKNLKTLQLSRTLITSLPADLLTDLDQLEIVELENCPQLQRLSSDFFQRKTSIRKIKIRKCSNINLPPNIFDGLVNLQKLDLTSSNMRSFPQMKQLTNLEEIRVTERLTWKQVYQLRKKVLSGVKLYWGDDNFYQGSRCYLFNWLPVLD